MFPSGLCSNQNIFQFCHEQSKSYPFSNQKGYWLFVDKVLLLFFFLKIHLLDILAPIVKMIPSIAFIIHFDFNTFPLSFIVEIIYGISLVLTALPSRLVQLQPQILIFKTSPFQSRVNDSFYFPGPREIFLL